MIGGFGSQRVNNAGIMSGGVAGMGRVWLMIWRALVWGVGGSILCEISVSSRK